MNVYDVHHIFALLLVVSTPAICQSDQSCPVGENPASFYLQASAIEATNSTSTSTSNCLEDAGDNFTCLANPQANLECMCGEKLAERQALARARMRESCSTPGKSSDDSSPLGFCQSALEGLGYEVTMVEPDSVLPGLTLYDNCSLSEAVNDLRRNEATFSAILNRTIVGIYLESEEQRCACREAYREWLCATKLRLYMVNASDTESGCCNISSWVGLEKEEGGGGGRTIRRFRPCLTVCHRVLQMCPYYLPSNFQPNRSPNASNMTYLEQVYGGYPAFDCPREDIMIRYCNNCTKTTQQQNFSVSVEDVPSCSSSYAFPNCSVCLGRSGCMSRQRSGTGPVLGRPPVRLLGMAALGLLFVMLFSF